MEGFTSPLAAWAETQAWEGPRWASRRWRRATQRAFRFQAGFGDLDTDPKTLFLRLGLPPTSRWRRAFQRGSEHVWRRTHTVLRLLKEKVEDTGSEWNSEHWKDTTQRDVPALPFFLFSGEATTTYLCMVISVLTQWACGHTQMYACVYLETFSVNLQLVFQTLKRTISRTFKRK